MKRILGLALAALILVSALPVAYAADYSSEIEYMGQGIESYSVTIPAKLAPGCNEEITLYGTWAQNKVVKLTAADSVTLASDTGNIATLTVDFEGIELAGNDFEEVSMSAMLRVEEFDAIFGDWTGTLEYTVELKAINSFTLDASWVEGGTLATYQVEAGMTWAQWIDSKYCPEGAYFINGNTISNSAVAAENAICDDGGVQCSPDDVIKADSTYILF